MSLLRTTLAALSIVLLAVGYGASQWAFFHGTTAEYAKKVDSAPVRLLALAILILAIGFAFVRDREAPKGQS